MGQAGASRHFIRIGCGGRFIADRRLTVHVAREETAICTREISVTNQSVAVGAHARAGLPKIDARALYPFQPIDGRIGHIGRRSHGDRDTKIRQDAANNSLANLLASVIDLRKRVSAEHSVLIGHETCKRIPWQGLLAGDEDYQILTIETLAQT
jgi:hypothetical protein